ncbi:hypothetical protein ACQ4PT_033386 [Festuca glaucescens]
MPQYQELPCGGQVLDIDTALTDGILGCGPEPGDGALGDGGKQPVELRKMMDELDAAGDGGGDEAVPAVFICPISLEPMVDPATLCTGQTYERANISRWLALGHRTCPTTMQELWDDALTPNATLRQLIARLVLPPLHPLQEALRRLPRPRRRPRPRPPRHGRPKEAPPQGQGPRGRAPGAALPRVHPPVRHQGNCRGRRRVAVDLASRPLHVSFRGLRGGGHSRERRAARRRREGGADAAGEGVPRGGHAQRGRGRHQDQLRPSLPHPHGGERLPAGDSGEPEPLGWSHAPSPGQAASGRRGRRAGAAQFYLCRAQTGQKYDSQHRCGAAASGAAAGAGDGMCGTSIGRSRRACCSPGRQDRSQGLPEDDTQCRPLADEGVRSLHAARAVDAVGGVQDGS